MCLPDELSTSTVGRTVEAQIIYCITKDRLFYLLKNKISGNGDRMSEKKGGWSTYDEELCSIFVASFCYEENRIRSDKEEEEEEEILKEINAIAISVLRGTIRSTCNLRSTYSTSN